MHSFQLQLAGEQMFSDPKKRNALLHTKACPARQDCCYCCSCCYYRNCFLLCGLDTGTAGSLILFIMVGDDCYSCCYCCYCYYCSICMRPGHRHSGVSDIAHHGGHDYSSCCYCYFYAASRQAQQGLWYWSSWWTCSLVLLFLFSLLFMFLLRPGHKHSGYEFLTCLWLFVYSSVCRSVLRWAKKTCSRTNGAPARVRSALRRKSFRV